MTQDVRLVGLRAFGGGGAARSQSIPKVKFKFSTCVMKSTTLFSLVFDKIMYNLVNLFYAFVYIPPCRSALNNTHKTPSSSPSHVLSLPLQYMINHLSEPLL